jgi:hypothetical protein
MLAVLNFLIDISISFAQLKIILRFPAVLVLRLAFVPYNDNA